MTSAGGGRSGGRRASERVLTRNGRVATFLSSDITVPILPRRCAGEVDAVFQKSWIGVFLVPDFFRQSRAVVKGRGRDPTATEAGGVVTSTYEQRDTPHPKPSHNG